MPGRASSGPDGRQQTASLQENTKGPGPRLQAAKMLDTPSNIQEGENG